MSSASSQSELGTQRPKATEIPFKLQAVCQNPHLFKEHLRSRNVDDAVLQYVDDITALNERRVDFIREKDHHLHQRKVKSEEIHKLLKLNKTEEADEIKAQVNEVVAKVAHIEHTLTEVQHILDDTLSRVPNLLDDRVPDGKTSDDNIEVQVWNDKSRKIGNNFLFHEDIAIKLGGLRNEEAVKMSGSRFSILIGPLAKLERALIQYFLDFHSGRGYTEVSVPYIVNSHTLHGTGQLPKFEEDVFKIQSHDPNVAQYLIPTGEVPVTNIFNNQILDEDNLPLKFVTHTPCFRSEVGSHGRDSRGLLRQHQFHKVELVKITTPSKAEEEYQGLLRDVETVLEKLELPFRKVLLCSGDTGFSARICYDYEVWMPGQQLYREISSCSNCYDFQSRRMMTRFKMPINGSKGKYSNEFVYTMNGSGLAVGRALAAILENYQNNDGSVTIPEVLRPYMGNIDKLNVA